MSKYKYLRVYALRETFHRLPINWDEMDRYDRMRYIQTEAIGEEDFRRSLSMGNEFVEVFFQDWTVSNESMHAAIPLWEICQKPEIILTLDGTYSRKDDYELDEDTFDEIFDVK